MDRGGGMPPPYTDLMRHGAEAKLRFCFGPVVLFFYCPHDVEMDRDGAKKGTQVSGGLGHLDAGEAQKGRQDPQSRDEEDTLPGHCQKGGGNRAPDGLE